ncbi:MAG: LysR family transcriptional regulator [Puniceicoccales bacterium]|jgi:DNA-binding transcriptional LysR family regulator|nr:LysR family transcriptional regulator [Puniceicoccales bacterium]
MNIRTLKIFSDLVENANFSKTAKLNNVSQSAVSQKVRLLEERLNVNLLEKKQKSFQLTDEGAVFYHHAKLILSEYDTMLKDLQNYDTQTLGGISLLVNYWIGNYIIPHYVREYFKTSKIFTLDIHYGDYKNIQTANLDPRINLIVLESPLQNEGFASELFTKDEFVMVCLAQSEFGNRQTFSIEHLDTHPLIGFTKNHSLRLIFEQGLEKKISRPHYLMEFNQIELIKQAIEMHNGIAILPKSSVHLPREEHLFQVLPLKDMHIAIPLYLIYRKTQKPNRAMEHFIAILKGKTTISIAKPIKNT